MTAPPYEPPLWQSALGSFAVVLMATILFAVKLGGLWDIIPTVWWACGVCAMVRLHMRAHAQHRFWDYLLALSLGVITLALLSGPVKPKA